MIYSDFCGSCTSIRKIIEEKNLENNFNFVNVEEVKFDQLNRNNNNNMSFYIPTFFVKNSEDKIKIIPNDKVLSLINNY